LKARPASFTVEELEATETNGVVAPPHEEVDTRPVAGVRQILVVDESAADREALRAALEPLDRPVTMASTGAEALVLLLESDFALALIALELPTVDGFEIARMVRARERTQHLPIVFTTNERPSDTTVLHAYQLGAVDLLTKPVLPTVLRAKVAVFIDLQRHSEELAKERIEREFDNRRRDFETGALRRERDREQAANQELARLNEALAESDRLKDSFIAILAHELRNPLAPVRTCVDLLRQEPTLTPKMLEILDRQTNVLARLVDDLLDLSRIKADKIGLRPERVTIAEVIDMAITTSKPMVDERGHSLAFEPPARAIRVVADPIRLAQVISNLINNAARYTARGGHIQISCGETGEMAFVCVVDDGIGIPPELQATIFQMFVQERVAADGSGGLGLGLALSQRLIELHRGTLSVWSAGRGQGSTFELRVPLARSAIALPVDRRTSEIHPLQRPGQDRNRRIVIVDDNEDALELLAALLESQGYSVVQAHDGVAGLALIREQRPDLAFIDLSLPGLDGLGLVRQLRDEGALVTRLVALTGYGEQSDRELTREAGFHAHLVKPATVHKILTCIAEQLATTT
jgi:signal transduction histidine kinase